MTADGAHVLLSTGPALVPILNSTRQKFCIRSNPSRACARPRRVWASKEIMANDGSPENVRTARAEVNRQLFDILPVHGRVDPGEKQVMEFTYFAYPGLKSTSVALCKVAYGPEYRVKLSAESNLMKYSVEPLALDYGAQAYDRVTEKEIRVFNHGRVTFDFYVNLSLVSAPQTPPQLVAL